jgi:cytochrome c oxidase assembly protein subunit 11
LARRNRRTGIAASLVIAAMLGITAASAPLYDLFCRVTGYGGTPRIGMTAPEDGTDRLVTVQFNADVGTGLPWRFHPVQRSMTLPVGEERLAFYLAENRSDGPVVGRAVYNVTPHKIGSYFAKVHCFCFEEQTLQPGQRVEMPVSFFIDPAIFADPDTSEVRQITLSYTFFIDHEATAKLRAAIGDSTS